MSGAVNMHLTQQHIKLMALILRRAPRAKHNLMPGHLFLETLLKPAQKAIQLSTKSSERTDNCAKVELFEMGY